MSLEANNAANQTTTKLEQTEEKTLHQARNDFAGNFILVKHNKNKNCWQLAI